MLHFLTTCTSTHIKALRTKMRYNLGSRLLLLGAPDWWSRDPANDLTLLSDLPQPTHIPTRIWWNTARKHSRTQKENSKETQPSSAFLLQRHEDLPMRIASTYLHATITHATAPTEEQLEQLPHLPYPPTSTGNVFLFCFGDIQCL